MIVTAASVVSAPAIAGTETPIHVFGYNSDGSDPDMNGALLVEPGGRVVGTDLHGSTSYGEVFLNIPPQSQGAAWTHKIIYSFHGGADGYSPFNGLVFAKSMLYGATAFGGGGGETSSGCGVIYALTPPVAGTTGWTQTILHRFAVKDASDGCMPFDSNLVIDKKGSLYGTTARGGGASDAGTLFRLDPPASGASAWTETILHRFVGGGDGAGPTGTLSVDANGTIFGTTQAGGSTGLGTIWEYDPASAGEFVDYSFAGGADGASPVSGIVGPLATPPSGTSSITYVGATFQGGSTTCSGGCGTVFLFQHPLNGVGSFTKTTLYSFTSGAGGSIPLSPLTLRGTGAWGTTQVGGTGACSGGCGTIYSVTPTFGHMAYHFTTTYSFAGPAADGANPTTGMAVDKSNNLYGTTAFGGRLNEGTLFEYVP